MTKLICLLTFFLFLLTSTKSQQVPNFIEQDINGTSHNLYSYLNDGKVVVLDVFTTWCSSCWTLHNQQKFTNLYKTYGPDGTDQLVVLFVEGDVETPDESLTVDNPFGDWTAGIPYSIFCLLYTSPSPRDKRQSRMPSSA